MLLEERLGDQEVVAVAVVEGECDGARAQLVPGERAPKLAERHDAVTVAKKLHLLGEELRGDAQVPRVRSPARDAVVHEDHRRATLFAPAGTQPRTDEPHHPGGDLC